MTFWLFEGVRWHFDVKYDVRYHKISPKCHSNDVRMQKMIELRWKFVWINISTRKTRCWCQTSNILTTWRLRRSCDVKYDVRYEIAQNVIQMMLECKKMIELSWNFEWINIFTRKTRWWCQTSNILIWWRLRRGFDVKYDVRYLKNSPNCHKWC